MELGFKGCAVEVFCYLWDERTYKGREGSSSHEIFQGVRALHLSSPAPFKPIKATGKSVNQAIADLCSMGFVDKFPPSKKYLHEGPIDGRPPTVIFRLKSAGDMNKIIETKLAEKKRTLYEKVFSQLEAVEEAGKPRKGVTDSAS